MKRLAQAEEGTARTPGRSQADVGLSKILSSLDPTKKRARSVTQHWMHENWTQGAQVSHIVARKWDDRADASVTQQPPNFRMEVAAELFENLSEDEKTMWKDRTAEYAAQLKSHECVPVSKDTVDIAA